MIVIAINKKKSLDMFKSRKKIENINDFLNYGKFLSKRKCLRGGRTDSQSSLSSFYNIDWLINVFWTGSAVLTVLIHMHRENFNPIYKRD